MAIPDAATVGQRWQQGASAGTQRFVEGIQSTTKDPTALAVAAGGKYLANVQAAYTSGRWARGLQRAGKSGWQTATVAKAGNYSTGISAAQDKYAAAIGPVLQVEAQLQAQIAQMPNNSIEDAIARSAAMQRGLHNWK